MKTSFLSKLLDTLAPRQCANCGRRLSPDERVLCHACYRRLELTYLWQNACDNPLARLFWGVLPIEKAASLFYFTPRTESSQVIYDMKYHDRPDIARSMGAIAARLMAADHFFDGIDGLVPVPLTRRRQWQRGYNQSMEIARGISEVTALPIYGKAVRRTKFHDSQTTKTAIERRDNVADVFRLADSNAVRGLHLLIIDDIITTGATVTACGLQLSQAEGVRVSVFSLGFTHS